jgi:hypothetical protein
VKLLVALLIGSALFAALAWIGSELHYRSCVLASEARTPVVVVREPKQGGWGEGTTEAVRGQAARKRAIDGCSRLPF